MHYCSYSIKFPPQPHITKENFLDWWLSLQWNWPKTVFLGHTKLIPWPEFQTTSLILWERYLGGRDPSSGWWLSATLVALRLSLTLHWKVYSRLQDLLVFSEVSIRKTQNAKGTVIDSDWRWKWISLVIIVFAVIHALICFHSLRLLPSQQFFNNCVNCHIFLCQFFIYLLSITAK